MAVLAVTACLTTPALAMRPDDQPFSVDAVMTGSTSSPDRCTDPDTALWVVVDGQGDCIRYYGAGFARQNPVALVYLHGDVIDSGNSVRHDIRVSPTYAGDTPGTLQQAAAGRAQAYGMPYVYLARPGVYGSSGSHPQRRRPRESALVDAALTALKQRYAVTRFALAGQSGGGYLVATMIERRKDVACAVIGSGVTAVRVRNTEKHRSADATGYTDFLDPIDEVARIPRNPEPAIFVLTDKSDLDVSASSQAAFVAMLRQQGFHPHQAFVTATGPLHHVVSPQARAAAAQCARGVPADAIVTGLTSGGS